MAQLKNVTSNGEIIDIEKEIRVIGLMSGTSLDGLPAGVYIINNKKVFVK